MSDLKLQKQTFTVSVDDGTDRSGILTLTAEQFFFLYEIPLGHMEDTQYKPHTGWAFLSGFYQSGNMTDDEEKRYLIHLLQKDW